MSIEKQKQTKQSPREIESHHFDPDPSGGVDSEFFIVSKNSLETAMQQLLLVEGTMLVIDKDLQGSTRALVKNNKGEVIFSTNLSSEIEELAGAYYAKH